MKKFPAILVLVLTLPSLLLAQAKPDAAAFERAGFKAERGIETSAFSGRSLDGSSFDGAAALRGRPALIFLFAPTYASVRQVFAALERVRKEAGDRMHVIAVTSSSLSSAQLASKGLGTAYPIVAEWKGGRLPGLQSAPAFVLTDPEGRSVFVRSGYFDWTSESGKGLLGAIVAAYASSPAPGGTGSQPSAAPPPEPAQSPAPSAPTVPAGQGDLSFLSPVEAAVVAELNLARTDPKAYAEHLREYRSFIRGNRLEMPGQVAIVLNEGVAAVDEAIRFLEKQAALGPLTASRGMSKAAGDHARDQGSRGATGHSGSDGSSPFDRMNRYGSWKQSAGENCSYGPSDARDIVIGLIVDDGVASRGHRANIFSPEFKVVGIAVGPHPSYGTVCVMDLAGGYAE
jgi:uncharacterized protein YkwD